MKESWKGKRVVILGLGQYPAGSGIAAALFMARAGADVLVSDFYYTPAMDANVARLKKFKNVRFIFNQHPLDEIRSADLIIKHQRIRQSEPEVVEALKRNILIESAESLFLRLCPCPVVGITGTRGKSTTSTLVAEMLKTPKKQVWLGGNILLSPLTFLSKIKPSDIVVLELSSFQLEGTGFAGVSPKIACVTNVMLDHLNAYSGMEEYAEAKAQIFRHQTSEDVVVLNGDNAYGREWASEAPGTVCLFRKKRSAKADAWLDGTKLVVRDEAGEVVLADSSALKVFGEHLYLNMLAAALTAHAAGASWAGISKAIRAFKGLADRQEVVTTKQGVTYMNDTTATTPDGVIAALNALDGRFGTIRLILGGSDKELNFTTLAKRLKRTSIDVVVLPGTAHEKLTEALRSARVSFEDVRDLKAAVAALRDRAVKGDAIVLSPGCASYGQFANEFERGKHFRRLALS